MTFVTNLGEEQHIWPVLTQMREQAIAAHRASVIAMSQAAEHQGVTEEQLSAELEDVMRLAELPVPPGSR